MRSISLKRITAAVAAMSLATAACAQYVWLDEKGVKQYSDMAPPTSIPQNRILKQPASAPRTSSQEASTSMVNKQEKPESAKTDSSAPLTTADKNADFNKRRMEQAEKDKKAAERAKAAADKTKNCERTRSYNQSLANGERIYRTDKNGERDYLTDEQRAQQIKENNRYLDECK